MRNEHDVIIVGGGIIGASLALLLAKISKNVAILEETPFLKSQAPSLNYSKTIVLSHSSYKIFEMLGIWGDLAKHAEPIHQIRVSDQGYFGGSRIHVKDQKIPALGYVLPAESISSLLLSTLKKHSNITLIQPAKFISFAYQQERVKVDIETNDTGKHLQGDILIAADGNFSSVRRFLGIHTDTIDYQQTAILCHVGLKRSHENIAYERFTRQGPLAILPLTNHKVGVIWTVDHHEANTLMNLSETRFLAKLQENFGYRLGKFNSCSQLSSLDLKLVIARQQIAPGVVLMGNAVHTLHPVAGQGLNLALRDAAILIETMQLADKTGKAPGSTEILNHYLAQRKQDQKRIIHLTHSLVGIFSNNLLPAVFARNMGMIVLDRTEWLKKVFTKQALGLAGKVPRLACGLPLE
jgi:2-octaprenyl-6-methoxyphenol hydroxylase